MKKSVLSPEERLALTLRFLSTGMSYAAFAQSFRLGGSTVHNVVKETTEAIYDCLRDTYLRTPRSEEEWLRVAQDFELQWQVPHALGCIDGKHVRIVAPAKSGSTYYNYKLHSSKAHLQLPVQLCRARRIIENVFGIMAMKWRVLLTTIGANPANAQRIVEAVCVLHNFLIAETPRGPTNPLSAVDSDDNDDNGIWRAEVPALSQARMRNRNNNRPTDAAIAQRDYLVDYFNGIGAVNWQDGAIGETE